MTTVKDVSYKEFKEKRSTEELMNMTLISEMAHLKAMVHTMEERVMEQVLEKVDVRHKNLIAGAVAQKKSIMLLVEKMSDMSKIMNDLSVQMETLTRRHERNRDNVKLLHEYLTSRHRKKHH